MANWYELYGRRMNSMGSNLAGAMSNTTKKIVAEKFSSHPSFTYVDIDGVRTGVRLMDGNRSHIKKLLFLPEVDISMGEYVEIGERVWLITDFVSNEPEGIFPSAEVKLCNNSLDWIDGGEAYSYPCVIENTIAGYQEVDSFRQGLNLPDDTIIISTKLNDDTNQIKYFQRFLFDQKRAWRINIIDNLSKVSDTGGVLQMLAKAVLLQQDEVDDPYIEPEGGSWWT